MSANVSQFQDGDVVVLGGTGMLGSAWRRHLEERGMAVYAPERSRVDLCRPETIRAGISSGTRLVINCAAYTDVDGAETHATLASSVNAEGPAAVAERCQSIGAMLIHYSTDYVFDGASTRPYRPDDPVAPINVYGETKARGDRNVRASGGDYLIIRTSWLYAPWGTNFVRKVCRRLLERDRLDVVNDQRGRPTAAAHLVRATWQLLEAGVSGTFHVCDGDSCTWYEFAREIARLTGARCRIEPCTSAAMAQAARRPSFSVLDLADAERVIGARPTWRANLADMLPMMRSGSADSDR